MKQIEKLGKSLTKDEMKSLKGGGISCKTQADCSCGQNPNLVTGQVCRNKVCVNINYCP